MAETFPETIEDTPSFINFPGERDRVLYGEDIFVGYRYYDKKEIEPAYPFGYGLSYTSFRYDNLNIYQHSKNDIDARDLSEIIAEISFTITNTGARAGSEVTQLYISAENSQVRRPIKELKGFDKVKLEPGESKEISFNITADDLAYYEPEIANWLTEPGDYQVLIGSSSDDIRLRDEINIASPITPGVSIRPEYHQNSTIGDIYQDPEAWEVLQEEISDNPKLKRFVSFDNAEMDIGIPNFLEYLPLRNLITFTEGNFTSKDIDRIVDKLNKS